MEWKTYIVRLMDEIPRLGSGERVVDVKVGRKWVYIKRHTAVGPYADQRFRLTVNQWTALKAKEM